MGAAAAMRNQAGQASRLGAVRNGRLGNNRLGNNRFVLNGIKRNGMESLFTNKGLMGRGTQR